MDEVKFPLRCLVQDDDGATVFNGFLEDATIAAPPSDCGDHYELVIWFDNGRVETRTFPKTAAALT